MKYKLSFALLLTPLSVFATLHCPAIDSISRIGGPIWRQARKAVNGLVRFKTLSPVSRHSRFQ